MNEDNKSGLKNFKLFSKLKSIKHIELIFVVFLCAVCGLIYLSTLKKTEQSINTSGTNYGADSALLYASELETKLKNALSSIKDAGNVDVMITLDGEIEYVYAKDEQTKQNQVTNGSQTTTSTTSEYTTLFDGDNPIVVKQIMPDILGVVVIASGANNASVRLNIISAVEALLNVPSSKIQVLIGK